MTATEELRRLLDERGVEWRKPAQEYWVLLGMPEGDSATIVGELSIEEATDGTLVAYNLTPAQAIAATLGRGECEADETDTIKCWVKCKDEPSTEHAELIHVMECSACGGTYEHVNVSYEFCPRCGRKLVTT